MRRWCAPFLLVLAAMAAPAAAAGPYLITDLNTGRAITAEPAVRPGLDSVELDGLLYFAADDGMHGLELWRTDGTSEGTELVIDICPGPCSSGPGRLTVFGDLIGFSATDDLHGHELWVTDGTRAGTRMPRDLCSGVCPSVRDLAAVGDRLFFVTQVGLSERLAVTDGTAAGTRIVLDPGGFRPLRMIGEVRGRLAFLGPGAAYYSALWWSDGTPEGTSLALDLCTSPNCSRTWSTPKVVGDRIVFWGRPSGPDPEIWASDGTASGTRKIGNAHIPVPSDAVLWKGSLHFAAFDSLWQTDGTPEGTRRLRTFTEGLPQSLLPFGDVLLFVTGGTPGKRAMIWQSLGKPGSTTIMIEPVPNDPTAQVGPLTRVGDRVYFPVVRTDRSEIWESNGTASGTRRLSQLCGGSGLACPPYQIYLAYPAVVGDRYLVALAEETYGYELWTVDAAGPRLVRDIRRNAGSSRFRFTYVLYGDPPPAARDLAALGSRLVFSARTASDEPATLWTSDGTAAGTLEIRPGVRWPHGLVRIGDHLWFLGGYSPGPWSPWNPGAGLWTTDGTAAGTVGVAPDTAFSSHLLGGRPGLVLAGGIDGEVGGELWASNGTRSGTGLLKDINLQRVPWPFPGDGDQPGSSDPAHFTLLGSSVLFAADDGLIGREPWITDGTAAGTRLLRDVNPGAGGPAGDPLGSSPGPFVPLGARAWFAADDGISGRELWSTDGTPAGTVRVRDVRPGPASSNPRDLVQAGTRLFFLADVGASDALWTISPQGRVTRVRLLQSGQRASRLMAVGKHLFFVVDSAETGPELWTSDGTRPGTRMVDEISPGVLGSYPQELTAVDGLLLFAADDGVHGLEPWVTDGTAAGTRLLADLAPGADASGPASFAVAGDLVGFEADDGVHGREVWAVRKEELAPGRPHP